METLPMLGGILGALLGVLVLVLVVTLAVLWVMLPFAVFGIKNRLDKLIALQTVAAAANRPTATAAGATGR